MMSRVKSKNTKPEVKVRKLLFSKRLRYRVNYPILGKPDIAFPREKIAVFINGCFWHGHSCNKARLPKTNINFWEKKIKGNIKRDKLIKKELKERGWNVLVIWECEIKNSLNKKVNEIYKLVKSL